MTKSEGNLKCQISRIVDNHFYKFPNNKLNCKEKKMICKGHSRDNHELISISLNH